MRNTVDNLAKLKEINDTLLVVGLVEGRVLTFPYSKGSQEIVQKDMQGNKALNRLERVNDIKVNNIDASMSLFSKLWISAE